MMNGINNNCCGLTICQWNVNGWSTNISKKIEYIIKIKNPDILLLQEVYIRYDLKDYIINVDGYRCVYGVNYYGKCVILVRNNVIYQELNLNIKFNNDIDKKVNDGGGLLLLQKKLYLLGIRVKGNGGDVLVFNYYRPQNNGGSDIKLMMDYIDGMRNRNKNDIIIFGGDANVHGELWMNGINNIYSKNYKEGKKLEKWINDNNINLLNDGTSTRVSSGSETAPDISFYIGGDGDIFDWNVEDYGGSDHRTIFIGCGITPYYDKFGYKYYIKTSDDRDWDLWNEEINKYIEEWNVLYGNKFNYILDDYKLIQDEYIYKHGVGVDGNCYNLSGINIDDILVKNGVDKDYLLEGIDVLLGEFINISKDVLGIGRYNPIKKDRWMNDEVRTSIMDFTRFERRFRGFGRRKKRRLGEELDRRRNKMEEICNKRKVEFMDESIRNTGQQLSWKQINNIIDGGNKNGINIPPWIDDNGDIEAVTNKEKVDVYLDYIHRYDEYKSVAVNDDEGYQDILNKFIDKRYKKYGEKKKVMCLNNLNKLFTFNEINKFINKCNDGAASGDDLISHKLIKRNLLFKKVLVVCYNIMYITGIRLDSFGDRYVVLVPKAGKKGNKKTGWRPISIQTNIMKPMDKCLSYRLLEYCVELEFIDPCNFGFIRGLNCGDAILYLLEIIERNNINGTSTHLVSYDFQGAYDTVDSDILLDLLEKEFLMDGNVLKYIRICLKVRKGRVKIFGIYSEWRVDRLGLPQGWPESCILFILFTVDLAVINDLNMGVRLVSYADDNNLISDGTIFGGELQRNINWINGFIRWFIGQRRLFMQTDKQKYIVINKRMKIKKLKNEYLDLVFDGEEIPKVYDKIRYLGYYFDINCNGDYYRSYVYRNAKNIYIKLYNKFRFMKNINAFWIWNIANAFILSKLNYCIEIYYGDGKGRYCSDIKVLYNDVIRWCNGLDRSAPLNFQYLQLGCTDFDQYVIMKRCNMWSRLIRTPRYSVLFNIIYYDYWYGWINWRKKEKFLRIDNKDKSLWCNEWNKYVEDGSVINGIDYDKIEKNEWLIRKEDDDEYECNDDNNDRNGFMLDKLYLSAREMRIGDYYHLLDIGMYDINARRLYHVPVFDDIHNLVTFYGEDDDRFLCFNVGWLNEYIKNEELDTDDVVIIGTDGSVKDYVGGSGFVMVDYDNYVKGGLDLDSKGLDYCLDMILSYGGCSVAMRCSIEYCELIAIKMALQEFVGGDYYHSDLFILVDSEVVIKWIVGDYDINNWNVYYLVLEIRKIIKDLSWINFYVIWVKSHQGEIVNEMADSIAKISMINYHRTFGWKDMVRLSTMDEWRYFNIDMIKNMNKRCCIEKFNKKIIEGFKDDRYKIIGESRLYYFVKWKYYHNHKLDMKNIGYWNWKILNRFRSGTILLNGNKRRGSKICDKCCYGCLEDINHYLLYCDYYDVFRKEWFDNVKLIHDSFDGLNDESKLKFILYPYESRLFYGRDLNEDERQMIMYRRYRLINLFCRYVESTGRFSE